MFLKTVTLLILFLGIVSSGEAQVTYGDRVFKSNQDLYLYLRGQMPTAVVNGATITHEMVNNRMNQARRVDFFDVHKKYEDMKPAGFRVFIREQLIDEMIAVQAALVSGLTVDTTAVQAETDRFLGGDPAQAQRRLDLSGIQPENLADQAARNLLIDKFRALLATTMPAPTEDEMKAFYESHRVVFETTPEMILARKIEIHIPEGVHPTGPEYKAFEDRAQDLFRRLKEGEDFAALADRSTEDPEGIGKGGSLGWVNRVTCGNDMIWEILTALDSGSLMDAPRYLPGRIVILKVEERREPVYLPYESVTARIRKGLEIEFLKNWIAEKRKDSEIVYYEDLTQGQVLKGVKPNPTYFKN